MTWASTGEVAAAARFWPVFCTPRARPAQASPASSATAVKARPLVLTDSATAASSATTASGDRPAIPRAVSPTTTVTTTASVRMGRSRLPTRSDQRPAASRLRAPARLATAMTRPASTALQPRLATRYSSANPVVANCGTTSRVLAAWMRQSTGARYGLPGGAVAVSVAVPLVVPVPRPGRGGAAPNSATAAPAARHNAPQAAMAAASPADAASGGSAAAASMVPSGWAVCRAPMARPRSEAPNQPSTSRPLAALTEAPPAPAQPSSTPRLTGLLALAAAIRQPPAMTSPAVMTIRSPYRSAAAPQATRATMIPMSGVVASVLAPVSDRPSWWRRSGTRYGSPYRNTQLAA